MAVMCSQRNPQTVYSNVFIVSGSVWVSCVSIFGDRENYSSLVFSHFSVQ